MRYQAVEKINAFGHSAVKATHRTTFEITKEEYLTSKGDCILAVGADKGICDLSDKFKRLAAKDTSKISIVIEVDGLVETAMGKGSSLLTFIDKHDIVARKSSFICGRTIMVGSNKAAADFSRELVKKLRNSDANVSMIMTVMC